MAMGVDMDGFGLAVGVAESWEVRDDGSAHALFGTDPGSIIIVGDVQTMCFDIFGVLADELTHVVSRQT